MDETVTTKSSRNENLDFVKKLGRKFAENAAASAGVTAGIMIILRIAMRNTGVKLSKTTHNS